MQPIPPRREQGFTLIELLVVMIIISILMAVAVPTFLSQKNTALKTQATANIKQVVNAIESCAAQITTGGYVDNSATPPMSCGDGPTLEGYEKSLTQLKIQAEAPAASAAGSAQTQVALTASQQGYMVQKVIADSGKFVFFAEIHTDAGDLFKLCSTTPLTIASTTGAADPVTKTCKTGKW